MRTIMGVVFAVDSVGGSRRRGLRERNIIIRRHESAMAHEITMGHEISTGHDKQWMPPGWTVQEGNCGAYKGPVGRGWNTPNGCQPGYTIQGSVCKPYIGR
jgi:hypothetical protein